MAAFAALIFAGAGTASATDYSDPNNWGDDGESLLDFDYKTLDPRLHSTIKQNAENN